MKLSKNSFLFSVLVFLGLFACTERDKNGKVLDTTTSGTMAIAIDESVKPVFETVVRNFHETYKNAHLIVDYKPEADAINDLMKDSVKLAIVCRELNDQEKEYFHKIGLRIRTTKVAYDAVSLIGNTKSPDSNLTSAQLKGIFSGSITNWNQLNPKFPNKPLKIVFDNSGSSILRFLKDQFHLAAIPANFFAVKGNKQVLEYVKNNQDAIGAIGVNWISGRTDSTAGNFNSDVKILALAPPDSLEAEDPFYQPYQAYIYYRYYPLVRTVYAIDREGRYGLATGFAAYAAGPQGQALINMAALVPASMPIRIGRLRRNFEF